MLLLRIAKVSVFIGIVETPFTTALINTILAMVEGTREVLGLRLRELVLRGSFKVVVGGRIREVWIDSWGTLVVNGGIAKEPGDVVRFLHGVWWKRGLGLRGWICLSILSGRLDRHRPVTSYPGMPSSLHRCAYTTPFILLGRVGPQCTDVIALEIFGGISTNPENGMHEHKWSSCSIFHSCYSGTDIGFFFF